MRTVVTRAGHDRPYQCPNPKCNYIYDSRWGDKKGKVPPGTRFEDVPDDWRCPYCGAGREKFRRLAQGGE